MRVQSDIRHSVTRSPTEQRPLVIAHRGHSLGAPEQTLAAYEAAARLGADMIEADIHRTVDGHLVMLHDATLDRTTDGHGPVAAHTLAEIRSLDAGSWFAAEFAGQRVPTLAELFDLADGYGIGLCLEIKGETRRRQTLIADLVADEIAVRGRLDRDVLASFDPLVLASAATAIPGLVIAPDRLPERGPSSVASLIGQAGRIGARIIQHHHEDLSAEIVAGLHAAGVAVWAWPPNTTAEIERSYAMGVDALMGDDVAAIVEVIGRPATAPAGPARD